MSDMSGLTPRQRLFAQEYLKDLNATQAAIRAGYSAKTANEQGARLIAKVSVRSQIERAQQERSERTRIDADWVLRRLASEAEADIADLYDDDGNLLPIKKWPQAFRRGLVVSVDTVQDRDGAGDDARGVQVRRVRLQDRSKTIELIGKHVGVQAFRDRLGVEMGVDLSKALSSLRGAGDAHG
jgi:phage terminase small subunit